MRNYLKESAITMLVLFLTFIVSFFVTTAVFDTVERATGYYEEAE